MRPIGTHRGNAVVRSAVERAARRRLWATLTPHEGVELPGPDPTFRVRFTRRFFDRILEHVLPRMAVALAVDDSEVRYFGADDLCLWAMHSPGGLVLAYECGEAPELLRERARRWAACLRTRTAPGMVTPHWGHPVYGARLDPLHGDLDVVWATPGSWCSFVLADGPERRGWKRPPHWQPLALA